MERLTQILRDAVGTAPRERVVVDFVCAVLCVSGVGLIGAAAFEVLAKAAGPQVARLGTGAGALALAGLVWAIGAARARRRKHRAAAARAHLTEEAKAVALDRSHLVGPAAAFVFAFLAGRNGS